MMKTSGLWVYCLRLQYRSWVLLLSRVTGIPIYLTCLVQCTSIITYYLISHIRLD